MEGQSDNDGDPLSALPDDLIHRIMSFLSPAESAQFSTLSKRLSSAHLSFPSLDFQFYHSVSPHPRLDLDLDFDFLQRDIDEVREDQFLSFVRGSLERRRTLKTSFQRLGFMIRLILDAGRIQRDDYISRLNSVTDLLDNLLHFALHKNITELNLHCYDDNWIWQDVESLLVGTRLKRLPNAIFSAETIKIMNLCGLILSSEDLILSCPLIEDFRLDRCFGLKSIQISSRAKRIRTVYIHDESKLKRIHVHEDANLESFSYAALFDTMIDINLASRRSLKFLNLHGADITEEWFRNNVSKFEMLETLRLAGGQKLRNICIHNKNLKCLELNECLALENVDILVSGLESFMIYVEKLNLDQPECKINIKSCKFLKNLILNGACIRQKWIEDNLSGLRYLENLELQTCQLTFHDPVKVCFDNLKSMEFSSDPSWYSVEIECPKLVSYRYLGRLSRLPPVSLVSSNLKDVEIFLDFWFRNNGAIWFHRDLRNFMSSFAHCDTVLLSSRNEYTDYFIYPERVKKKLIPPLYGVKHLKIDAATFSSERIVKLVDSLLWFSPHPETISFLDCTYRPHETKFIIKFYYGEPAYSEVKQEEDNNVTTCCSRSPVRCWRHDLTEVAIENFEDTIKMLWLFSA